MMYTPRVSLAEAAPVQLGDSRLMVVEIDGRPQVVAADSFLALFRPVEEAAPAEPVHQVDKKARPVPFKKAKAKRGRAISIPPKAAAVEALAPVEGDSEMTTSEAVFRAVDEKPRGVAETQDRVLVLLGWPESDKKYRDRVYQSIWANLKAGKLEKRTDPETQLSHLYRKGA